MELLVVVIISSLISAVVGYFIDKDSGALWGFFLGPIGWIIAAILKDKNGKAQHEIRHTVPFPSREFQSVATITPAKPASNSDELRKWNVLKEVDAEIRAASQLVVEVDPQLDSVLAEKYLALNDKQYLQSLTDVVLKTYKEKKAHDEAVAAALSTEARENGARSKRLYEMSLGSDWIAPETGTRVHSVEIYEGSWVNFKGGIRIILEDGRNMLMHKSMRRDFAPGDDKWK